MNKFTEKFKSLFNEDSEDLMITSRQVSQFERDYLALKNVLKVKCYDDEEIKFLVYKLDKKLREIKAGIAIQI